MGRWKGRSQHQYRARAVVAGQVIEVAFLPKAEKGFRTGRFFIAQKNEEAVAEFFLESGAAGLIDF